MRHTKAIRLPSPKERSVSQVSSLLRDQHAHICTTGCTQLQQLCLSRNLRIIEQEAFPKCTSLQEVSIPPSLLYIARRAFAGCTQLRATRKQGKSKTWRGTYARPNAFDKCEQLDQPKWLRFLPADANDLWREDFLEPAPKASNAVAAGMVHKHSARKLRQVKCANIE